MALPSSGPLTLTDIQTEFGGSNPISLSEYYAGGAYVAAGTSGTYGAVPSSGAIGIQNFYGTTAAILAPVGLIVPYTGDTAPTNWQLFTAANGRLIVGAGGAYASTTTGGSSSTTFSGSLSTNGSHTGSQPQSVSTYYTGDSYVATYSAGNHSHTFSGGVTTLDLYKTFTLIKCVTAAKIPANAMFLANTSLANLTNVETTTDRFIYANSSYGSTGGSSTYSGGITTSSNGSHKHGENSSYGGENMPYVDRFQTYAGGHTHSATVSGTLNTKRIYLSAWTNASAAFGMEINGIAMYEGTTAPTGWVLCNGTAGTPDLRDYFIRIGTTSNHGTTAGNNSSSWSASASSTVTHGHESGADVYVNASAYHSSWGWSHSHTASGSGTITQPYYALSFIKYVG